MPDADQARYRDWLLGRLGEDEAARIESELIDSHETFETVRGVESDLFDEFASGTMTDSDREAFLRRYRNPEDRQRLLFAKALAHRTTPGNVVTPARFRRHAFLAAAAVLVVAVSALLLRPSIDEPVEITRIAEAPAIPAPVVSDPAIPDSPAVPAPRLPVIVDATIILGTIRGEASVPAIVIPPDTDALRLRVELHPDDAFERYAMQLRAPDGRLAADLTALDATAEDGSLALVAEIPAANLSTGTYELAVAGISGGMREDLGFETLRVRRDGR